MDGPGFFFLPGEFVRWKRRNGDINVGRIHSIADATLSVVMWIEDETVDSADKYSLPPVLIDTPHMEVIPKPLLSSVVFVFHVDTFSSYKARYIYGMENIYCTRQAYDLRLPLQSLSSIIYDGLVQISLELQRVLYNRRENQQCFSSFSVNICNITWQYLTETLQIPVIEKERVITYSVPFCKDLSTIRVKGKFDCKVLRVDSMDCCRNLISILGIAAVVGVRKRPPTLGKRLIRTELYATTHGEVQLADTINFVDVQLNDDLPPRENFVFNDQPRKGIDFIFLPQARSLKVTVRYKHYVLRDALDHLREIGVARNYLRQVLTDEELEVLIRG